MFVSISTAVTPSPARTSAKSDNERSNQDFPVSVEGVWVMAVIGFSFKVRVRYLTRQGRENPAGGKWQRVASYKCESRVDRQSRVESRSPAWSQVTDTLRLTTCEL